MRGCRENDRHPHHGGFHHGRPHPQDEDSLEALMHHCMHSLRHGSHAAGQDKVLRLLAEKGPLAQRALQEQLGIQAGSLSELIGKLEAKGLLERERDESDRRRVTLHITDTGRAALDKIRPRQDPFAVLTAEEQEQLRTLLKKVLAAGSPSGE